MEPLRLHAADLAHLLPELTLLITAIVLSLLDLLLPSRLNRGFIGWLSLAGLLLSSFFVMQQLNPAEPVVLLHQSFRVDDFGNILKLIILGSTALITFMSIGWVDRKQIPHTGEFYYLLLPAALGAMITASSGDLITLYVGLELLSISTYILVAMKKKEGKSGEAAFKYVVLGSISSAFILYGMSFLYGISGTTNIAEMAKTLPAAVQSYELLLYMAVFFLIAGFGFKISAAPFHNWAPDVYQGAPTPVTAFLAVVSKLAGFSILFRLFYGLFTITDMGVFYKDVFLAISVVAAVSMIAGNVIALRQNNVKRLLAYSGIVNAGYLLVPIGAFFGSLHFSMFTEFIYYLIAYAFMNIGAFGVLMVIEKSLGTTDLKGFTGLFYRAPYTAVAMTLIVFSLAGMPVTGGFFGKLYILLGSMEAGNYWLAAVMLLTSVISFFYYFGILRQMFMRTRYNLDNPIRIPFPLGMVIWICALLGVIIGFYPQGILEGINQIFSFAKDLLFFIVNLV